MLKSRKSLRLSRETLTRLTETDLRQIQGGQKVPVEPVDPTNSSCAQETGLLCLPTVYC